MSKTYKTRLFETPEARKRLKEIVDFWNSDDYQKILEIQNKNIKLNSEKRHYENIISCLQLYDFMWISVKDNKLTVIKNDYVLNQKDLEKYAAKTSFNIQHLSSNYDNYKYMIITKKDGWAKDHTLTTLENNKGVIYSVIDVFQDIEGIDPEYCILYVSCWLTYPLKIRSAEEILKADKIEKGE